jgi:hypothetical protein
MLDVLDDLIRRHRDSGILIDTNLLLVFLMALWNEKVTLDFKRTQGYTADELTYLKLIVGEFQQWIVTPSVLAEVSNLAGQLPHDKRNSFFAFLSKVLANGPFVERFTELPKVVDDGSCFARLGFTDASIERLGASGIPVLTDDAVLYVRLQQQSIESFNFHHVRDWAED